MEASGIIKPPDPKAYAAVLKTDRKGYAEGLKPQTLPDGMQIAPNFYKGKPALLLTKDQLAIIHAPFKFALIGRFAGRRPIVEEIRKQFLTFGLKGAYTVGLLDNHHVLIRLDQEEDFHRMWLKESWQVGRYNMKVMKWTPHFNPNKESSIVPIWVSLPNLPVEYYAKNILFSIGNMLGSALKIDVATHTVSRPSVARLCIAMDLLNTFPDAIYIQGEELEGFWQEIIYDNKPLYCSKCSQVGHAHGKCTKTTATNTLQIEAIAKENDSTNRSSQIEASNIEKGSFKFISNDQGKITEIWRVKPSTDTEGQPPITTSSTTSPIITIPHSQPSNDTASPFSPQIVSPPPATYQSTSQHEGNDTEISMLDNLLASQISPIIQIVKPISESDITSSQLPIQATTSSIPTLIQPPNQIASPITDSGITLNQLPNPIVSTEAQQASDHSSEPQNVNQEPPVVPQGHAIDSSSPVSMNCTDGTTEQLPDAASNLELAIVNNSTAQQITTLQDLEELSHEELAQFVSQLYQATYPQQSIEQHLAAMGIEANPEILHPASSLINSTPASLPCDRFDEAEGNDHEFIPIVSRKKNQKNKQTTMLLRPSVKRPARYVQQI